MMNDIDTIAERIRADLNGSLMGFTNLPLNPYTQAAISAQLHHQLMSMTESGLSQLDGDTLWVHDIGMVSLFVYAGKLEVEKTYRVVLYDRTHIANITYNGGPYMRNGSLEWDATMEFIDPPPLDYVTVSLTVAKEATDREC